MNATKQKIRPMEWIMNAVFFICGFIAIVFVLFISIYLIISGLPAIREIGLVDFLFGTEWASTAAEPKFGILPFILTSIYGTCGAILLMNPDLFVVLFIGFVPIAFITRIVSLASVLGASAYPILVYIKCRLIGRPPLLDVTFALICVALILYMHRENIKRLLNGTEKKIGRPGK